MEEIDKLKEAVAKSPGSTLFVKLADEHRKRGETEEAISVLNEGLKRQPNYVSAFVLLGKIHFDSGNLEEAYEEFKKVLAMVPENLVALRKIADIYRAQGLTDRAIEQYSTVLKINPMDEEAAALRTQLRNSKKAAAAQVPDALERTVVAPPTQTLEALAADAVASAPEIDPEEFNLEDTMVDLKGVASAAVAAEDDSEVNETGYGTEDGEVQVGGIEIEPDGIYESEDNVAYGGYQSATIGGIDIPSTGEEVQEQTEVHVSEEFTEPSEPLEAPKPSAPAHKALKPVLDVSEEDEEEHVGVVYVADEGLDKNPEYSGLSEAAETVGREILSDSLEDTAEIEAAAEGEEPQVEAKDPLEDTAEIEEAAEEEVAEVSAAAEASDEPAMAAPEEELPEEAAAQVEEEAPAEIFAEAEAEEEEPAPVMQEEAPAEVFAEAEAEEEPAPVMQEESPAEVFAEAEAEESFAMVAEEESAAPAPQKGDGSLQSFFAQADQLIASGEYLKAFNIYNALLSDTPDDNEVIQKRDELKLLLKLLGLDRELYQIKLRAFLSAVKRRQNEFLERA